MQSGASGIASVFSTCILVGRGESAGWKLPWPVCRGAVGPRGRQQLCLTVAGTQQAVRIRVSAADTGLSFSCCGLSIFFPLLLRPRLDGSRWVTPLEASCSSKPRPGHLSVRLHISPLRSGVQLLVCSCCLHPRSSAREVRSLFSKSSALSTAGSARRL